MASAVVGEVDPMMTSALSVEEAVPNVEFDGSKLIHLSNPYKPDRFLEGKIPGKDAERFLRSTAHWSWLASSLCPVRTGKLSYLAADLFLPTTVNQAARVQNIAARCLCLLGALVFDLITLALRVVMLVPRVIYNAVQPQHPLIVYVTSNLKDDVDRDTVPDLFDAGVLLVTQESSDLRELIYLVAFPEGTSKELLNAHDPDPSA